MTHYNLLTLLNLFFLAKIIGITSFFFLMKQRSWPHFILNSYVENISRDNRIRIILSPSDRRKTSSDIFFLKSIQCLRHLSNSVFVAIEPLPIVYGRCTFAYMSHIYPKEWLSVKRALRRLHSWNLRMGIYLWIHIHVNDLDCCKPD